MDARQLRRAIRAARCITEHELCAGILEDEADGRTRKLEIHRHRDKARAHRPETRGEVLRAVGGKDRDPIAAPKGAPAQRPRDRLGHLVEPRISEFARYLLAAEVDDRHLAEIAVAADQVPEIGAAVHAAHLWLTRAAHTFPVVPDGDAGRRPA